MVSFFFLTFGEEFYLFFYFVFTFIFILGSFWVFVLLVLPTASQAARVGGLSITGCARQELMRDARKVIRRYMFFSSSHLLFFCVFVYSNESMYLNSSPPKDEEMEHSTPA